MSETTAILLAIISLLFTLVQVFFMFILKGLNEEIKTLRERVHDLVETVTRLDAIVEEKLEER